MIDGDEECVFLGIVIGIVVTLLTWIFVAGEVEAYKVRSGYLTYQSKTYSVTLYDTLDTPEKEQ